MSTEPVQPTETQPQREEAKESLPLQLIPTRLTLPESVIEHYKKYQNSTVTFEKNIVAGSTFDMDNKYQIIDLLGQGAYGIVVAACDKSVKEKQNSYIAIKKIEKAFEHKIFVKRTIRELKILRLLQHENIVDIKTILLPKSRQDFNEIYLCQELMDTDLGTVIKSPQSLTNEHIQFFVYQILRGLKYIHSANIIHRDLKPRNLLVNANSDLKIADFGLSRAIDCTEDTKHMTDYVASRWYRAPELLLETRDYGPAVDMWAVGCIFAELFKRKPLLPGLDAGHQLNYIFDVFGTPSDSDIALVPNSKIRRYLKSQPVRRPKDLEVILPKASPLAIDLIKKMMTFNPQERITVEEALRHPYLQELHYPDDEPSREPVPSMEFEFDKHDLSREQLKDILYEEVLLYHFEDYRQEYMRRISTNENPYKEVFENENALKPGEKDPEDEDDDDS